MGQAMSLRVRTLTALERLCFFEVQQAGWQRESIVPGRDGGFFFFPTHEQYKEDFSMLDINLLRNDPEKVKENIRKKFQDQKLVLVDEVVALDKEYRESRQQADALRNQRKTLSKAVCWPRVRRTRPRPPRRRLPRWRTIWLLWRKRKSSCRARSRSA